MYLRHGAIMSKFKKHTITLQAYTHAHDTHPHTCTNAVAAAIVVSVTVDEWLTIPG